MTYETEPLSPELALVDPELAERARRALRAGAATADAPPTGAQAVGAQERDALAPAHADSPRSLASPSRPARAVRVAAALAVPSIILNVALLRDAADADYGVAVTVTAARDPAGTGATSSTPVASPPAPSHRARPETTPAPRRLVAAPRTPSPPRASVEPRTLWWAKHERARLYDVIVWRDGRRVKDVWTRKHSVSVRTLACVRDAGSLGPGRYLWFVYPVYAPTSRARHGSLLRWGSFHVTRETCRSGGRAPVDRRRRAQGP